MRRIAFLLSLFAGIVCGLSFTRVAIDRWVAAFGSKLGIWFFMPKIGAPDMDPYQRAWLFMKGELPLADGEGFSLRAEKDSSGHRLEASCSYRLEGTFPTARYWTLTVYDKNGSLIPNQAGRSGFSSSELVYPHGNPPVIVLAPDVQAGNWLPLAGEGAITLVLRFYETPLSASASKLNTSQIPNVTRIGCAG